MKNAISSDIYRREDFRGATLLHVHGTHRVIRFFSQTTGESHLENKLPWDIWEYMDG